MAKVNEIGRAVEKVLSEYKDATVATMKKAIDKTSKQAVRDLKADSPKRTGAYAKSWASKVDKKTSVLAYEKIVFNKKHYRLTHLLEKGHRKVNGGFVAARPHIAKVEQDAVKTLVKEIEKNV
jgi:uncharacterized membrane-anchored protein